MISRFRLHLILILHFVLAGAFYYWIVTEHGGNVYALTAPVLLSIAFAVYYLPRIRATYTGRLRDHTGVALALGLILQSVGLLFIPLGFTQRSSRSITYHGVAGVGYSYEYPNNFEFCGRETADPFNFTLYCFDDFRAMGQCVHGGPQSKDYSECDYQTAIQVNIESLSIFQNTDSVINQALQSRFPDAVATFQTIKVEDDEIVIAEIQSPNDSNPTRPSYLTVLHYRNDHIAIITAQTSPSGRTNKTHRAFETVVKSYEPTVGTKVGTNNTAVPTESR